MHEGLSRRDAADKSIEMLRVVRIPNPERRVKEYPHLLSGGMRQRVMIAMALSCNPKLLIADEPTTALDVTIQAQILDLLNELKAEFKMAVMLITHDMGVIAETAQRVVVMYGAQVVEEAPVMELFGNPQHPYTQGLLRSIPRIDLAATERRRLEQIPGHRSDAARQHQAGLPLCAALPVRAAAAFRNNAAAARGAAGAQGRVLPAMNAMAQSLLRVRNLKKYFPVRSGLFSRESGARPCGRRCQLRHRGGRNAGPRWRIGLRQIDHRPRDPAPDRADFRRNLVSRPQRDRTRRPVDAASPQGDPDDLPGPVFLARPAHDGRRRSSARPCSSTGLPRDRKAREERVVELLETVGLVGRAPAPLSA